jgi:hypothetical protein
MRAKLPHASKRADGALMGESCLLVTAQTVIGSRPIVSITRTGALPVLGTTPM